MRGDKCIFLNDDKKSIKWYSRNYFFAVTFTIVIINFIVFFTYGSPPGGVIYKQPEWNSFSITNLLIAMSHCYMHLGSQHCALNMLCFFVAGIYLERKTGSLRLLALVIVMTAFTAFATAANYISLRAIGFSGVNYGIYGFIITDYLFMLFEREKRSMFNIISGAIVLALIYFAMCFNGGTSTVSFVPYPYDLTHNIGHASGFVVGLLVGLYEGIILLIEKLSRKKDEKGDPKTGMKQ